MSIISVVGSPDLDARLPAFADLEAPAVVIGGAISERVGHAARAVRDGVRPMILWPPAGSALEAEDLVAHADEA
ncbi:hypothetical protein, partial [Rubrivirga sp.]|uniref:hypothetical protein n=1 Tax=Rubrivirga sp. TaxID=1885344 RepID=UPI003C71BA76